MNKVIIWVVGLIAVAGLVVGSVAMNKTPSIVRGVDGTQGLMGPQGPAGRDGKDGKDGVTKVVTEVRTVPVENAKLGAVPGNEVFSREFTFNGITFQFDRRSLAQATTTVCAIQSPTRATSTLEFATIVESVSSTSQSYIDIAKATTAFATTTLLQTGFSVSANAQLSGNFMASTTVMQANGIGVTHVFAPGTWLVINQATAPGLTVSPVGTCSAQFRVL